MEKLFFFTDLFNCFFFGVTADAKNHIREMQNEIELQQYNADKARQNKPAAASREIPACMKSFAISSRERSRTVAKMPMSVIQKRFHDEH